MADTGENREIKQRVESNQAEIIRESKQLLAQLKELDRSKRTSSDRQKTLRGKKKT